VSIGLVVALDVAAWVGISAAIGLAAGYLPQRLLEDDTAVTRIRPFEARGRLYRRALRVHRWKDLLPEVHGVGSRQHASKASLGGRDGMGVLLRETRRAEYVHLAIGAAGLSFFMWNPAWLALAMLLGGIAFNAPFVLIQRYNRARLVWVVARRPMRRAA
jgi:glycosyl-4,4'-diaponeurosporenoate acyltransferase